MTRSRMALKRALRSGSAEAGGGGSASGLAAAPEVGGGDDAGEGSCLTSGIGGPVIGSRTGATAVTGAGGGSGFGCCAGLLDAGSGLNCGFRKGFAGCTGDGFGAGLMAEVGAGGVSSVAGCRDSTSWRSIWTTSLGWVRFWPRTNRLPARSRCSNRLAAPARSRGVRMALSPW